MSVCVFDCRHCRIGVQHNSSCWHWYANWALQAYCVIWRIDYVPWITQQTGAGNQTAVPGASFEEWYRQAIGTVHSDFYVTLVSLTLKCPHVKCMCVVHADNVYLCWLTSFLGCGQLLYVLTGVSCCQDILKFSLRLCLYFALSLTDGSLMLFCDLWQGNVLNL